MPDIPGSIRERTAVGIRIFPPQPHGPVPSIAESDAAQQADGAVKTDPTRGVPSEPNPTRLGLVALLAKPFVIGGNITVRR